MKALLICEIALLDFALAASAAAVPSEAVSAASNAAETSHTQNMDITNLTLEELLNMKVTSASKKEESLSGAPAAIYVITSEEIRRSGLSSLPEILRRAPGLTVQQLNSHAWTVSTRGFNGFPNEKMLVLIDGRSVYDPLSGGVFWDVQDLRLQDIERIEVIRGPGGALWGANAINGVINIISKPANETQGASMDTSVGEGEGSQGSFRYGAAIGKSFVYRIYGKSSFWDPAVDQAGADMFNGWHLSDAGFRADWKVRANDNLSMDVAGYQGNIRDAEWLTNLGNSNMTNTSYAVAGGHVLARWRHTLSAKSKTDTLAYCDWTNRTQLTFGGEFRTTCDIEFQHDYTINGRHSFIWGGEFRSTADETPFTATDYLTPLDQRLNVFSGFGQYDINIIPNRVRVTLGSKFENSTYGGFDVLPQVRAIWSPSDAHHLWAAVSRTSRVPTRNEHDHSLTLFLPPRTPVDPPVLLIYNGNPKVHSEYQTAYEIGYRYQYRETWALDVAAFYNSYSGLVNPDMDHAETSFNPFPPYLRVAANFTNGFRAQTHGLEVSNKWRVTPWWQLDLGVTENRGTGFSMNANSTHQFSVKSLVDLPRHFAFDSALYHWNPFTAIGALNINVPTGNRVDAGVSWQGPRGFSAGVWGRNLQAAQHAEGTGASVASGMVRRSVVVRLSWDSRAETRP